MSIEKRIKAFKEDWYYFYWWNSPIRKIVKSPIHVYNQVKWFIQRGSRGWADCDTWNMDDNLSRVIKEQLRYLAENHNGMPNGYTSESWREKLLGLARAFEEYENYSNWEVEDWEWVNKSHGVSVEFVRLNEKMSQLEEKGKTEAYRRDMDAHYKRCESYHKDIIERMKGIFDIWPNLWD